MSDISRPFVSFCAGMNVLFDTYELSAAEMASLSTQLVGFTVKRIDPEQHDLYREKVNEAVDKASAELLAEYREKSN